MNTLKKYDLVIVEMHTILSMCGKCRKEAKDFIKNMSTSLPNKIKLRVSYLFEYFSPN